MLLEFFNNQIFFSTGNFFNEFPIILEGTNFIIKDEGGAFGN